MKPDHKKALDAIADKVLAYRPKPKSAPARSRKRRKAKLAFASHAPAAAMEMNSAREETGLGH